MSTTLIFVGVLVLGFLAARLMTRFTRGRGFAFAGVEFLLVGVVLGPTFAPRLLTAEVLHALDLLVSLLLGLVGFFAGLALRRSFRSFELGMAGVSSALAVIGVVATATTVLIQWSHPELLTAAEPLVARPLYASSTQLWSFWIAPDALWVGLGLAAAAGVSSVGLIRRVARDLRIGSKRVDALVGLAAAGHATAICVLGAAMAGSRATASAEAMGLTLTEWGVVVVACGAVSGLLFSVYLGREEDPMRMTVAAIGAVTFAAGAGAALRVSPLVVNLAAGAVVAVTSAHSWRLEQALEPLRYPASLLVLLFAGAYWRPVEGWLWLLPVGYVLLRALGRRIGTTLAVSTFVAHEDAAHGMHRGLVGHGALAAAVALGFAQAFPEHADIVLTTVLGGMLITEVLARRQLRRFLVDSGDVRPIASATTAQEGN